MNLKALIEQILDVTEEFPRDKAAQLIAMLLEEQATVNRMVPQINITNTPGAESNITFRPVASGQRKIDGKLYTVFQLDNAGILLRPHEGGTPLTDDQIAKTLAQWNAEAADTLKGIEHRE